MDVERSVRKELMGGLASEFVCHEEVGLVSEAGARLRCDVLAIPQTEKFSECPIAFECKRPSQDWHYAKWSRALKQAADYVGCTVSDGRIAKPYKIGAAFVFPSPEIVPSERQHESHPLIREGFENAIAGMFHLALHFRVGKAVRDPNDDVYSVRLVLGPNEIWNKKFGFTRNGGNLLLEGRPLGSRNRRSN